MGCALGLGEEEDAGKGSGVCVGWGEEEDEEDMASSFLRRMAILSMSI